LPRCADAAGEKGREAEDAGMGRGTGLPEKQALMRRLIPVWPAALPAEPLL